MRPRQGPSAHAWRRCSCPDGSACSTGTENFQSLQLANVKVAVDPVRAGRAVQPRKMSLSACIRCCPATTRSPWLRYWLRPQKAAQHRRLGLLGLQEQRFVLAFAALHQSDPGAGADAADPDHLAGQLDQGEVLEQVLSIGLQGAPVFA